MNDGTVEKKLGDIATISYGYTEKANHEIVGPHFLRITDLKLNGVDWDTVPYCQINKKEHEKHKLKTGDIVFARTGATTGKSYLVKNPPDSVCASYLIRLSLYDANVLPEFLILFFQTKLYWGIIDKGISGSAQGGFNASKLSKLSVPLPPLPEQKRIVAILDEAFAGVSLAVANTEKSLANARELFESYLNNVFIQKGDGWEEKQLSDFTKSVSTGPFGSLLHKSDYVTEGVPLVNPINIVNGEIIPDSSKLIGNSTKERLSSYILNVGDIVVGRRGEIGRCAVVDSEQGGWICGTGCFVIRPLADVNPEFLTHLLRSQTYRENLESVATGATMKNISNKALSNLIICIPSFKVQVSILNQISFLEQEVSLLETIYQQKLIALDELKQSILQKSFTGELTQREENV